MVQLRTEYDVWVRFGMEIILGNIIEFILDRLPKGRVLKLTTIAFVTVLFCLAILISFFEWKLHLQI